MNVVLNISKRRKASPPSGETRSSSKIYGSEIMFFRISESFPSSRAIIYVESLILRLFLFWLSIRSRNGRGVSLNPFGE